MLHRVWLIAIVLGGWGFLSEVSADPISPRGSKRQTAKPSSQTVSRDVPARSKPPSLTPQETLVRRGLTLLSKKGCLSCHSLNGLPMAGPTLFQLAGKKRVVKVGGSWKTVVADAAYLRRAIVEPQKERVKGYESLLMPKFSFKKNDVDAMVAAIQSLGKGSSYVPAARTSTNWIWVLLVVAILLLVVGLMTHRSVSGAHPYSW